MVSSVSPLLQAMPLLPLVAVACLAGFLVRTVAEAIAHSLLITGVTGAVEILFVSWLQHPYAHDMWVGESSFFVAASARAALLAGALTVVLGSVATGKTLLRRLRLGV
jgi:hypothetical protein